MYAFTEHSGYRSFPQYINSSVTENGMVKLIVRGKENGAMPGATTELIWPRDAILEQLRAIIADIEGN